MEGSHPRVVLLIPRFTYRACAFESAARKLNLDVVRAVEVPPGPARDGAAIQVDFSQPRRAVAALVEYAAAGDIRAIVPIDDSGVIIAAQASEALGLPHNPVSAAYATRNKYQMRRLFAQAGLQTPPFSLHRFSDDPEEIAARLPYPAVLKPLTQCGSRGVIRVNHGGEFSAAFERLSEIVQAGGAAAEAQELLVEGYIPGMELEVEGILCDGRMKLLAVLDKPDPLEGPYFEETILVTPSRLPARVQEEVVECTARAAAAVGLRTGPVHAELRVNERGPWMLEIHSRSIGGCCSKALRFADGVSLEELILRQAAGLDIESVSADRRAHGVMMIPIPHAGILRGVEGTAEAQAVEGIDEVQIAASIGDFVAPPPEGNMYLGFLFSTGDTPKFAEEALRQAHRRLRFEIDRLPASGKVTLEIRL